MSKGKDVKPTEKGTGVVAYDYGDEHKGGGYEGTSSADYAIPFLAILQGNSPQVDGSKGEDVKIKGAAAGMFMNTVSQELYEGAKEGLVFIPCATNRVYVEWKKRKEGGGMVARHAPDAELVRKCVAEQKFGKYEVNGNDLMETFYVYGMVMHPDGRTEMVCISFSSSKIKKYKQLMYRLGTYKGKPPLYANQVRLKTVGETNAKGFFQNFDMKPAIEDDVGKSLIPPTVDGEKNPILMAGKQLKDQVVSGAATADHKTEGAAAGTGDDTEEAF